MLSKIKLYIYSFVAILGIALFGWLKVLQTKNTKLHQKVVEQTDLKEVAERNTIVVEKKHADYIELNQALSEVKKEADQIEAENNENRIKKVRPSHGDVFGDSRLK